jgi:D-methionine transport system permease protein
MAGIVGAGGLGQYAQLAYQSFKTDWMWYAVLMILLIVLVIQVTGELLARKFNHKKKN